MANNIEKYAVITSASFPDNISIPIILGRSCKTLSLRNRSETIPVNITIKGIKTDVEPLETLIDHFEKDWFNSLLIETELGHNFSLELYRD
jgi:hypothetical protein